MQSNVLGFYKSVSASSPCAMSMDKVSLRNLLTVCVVWNRSVSITAPCAMNVGCVVLGGPCAMCNTYVPCAP